MLLGHEGEAFFLRQAFEDEAAESIENVSNSLYQPFMIGSGSEFGQNLAVGKDEPKQKGPKSVADGVQDDEEYKGSYFMGEMDIDQDMKKANNSSPKSAHHAMGLEAAGFNSEDDCSPLKK